MPTHLIPLLLFTLGTLGASAVPPPGRSGSPGGNGNVPVGQPVPPTTSSANWPTSAVSEWMIASYTSSLVASGVSESFWTTTATSAVQSAFSTTVSSSNGTTRLLASCAASMNSSVPSSLGFNFSGTIRRYYVAAEEVEWDYAPTGWDNWLGVPLHDSIRAKNAGYLEYGTVWTKALYRGYTDATFTQRTEQPAWQGTQGPILRAEVGDVIEILFLNNLTNHYATMHSMGLAYQKSSEGADYPDAEPGVNFKILEEDAVPPVEPGVAPGGCVVYKWMVTELAGPNEGEPARLHSYHSYVSLYEDANTGLIGPTIIYATGTMDKIMSEYREIPFLFMIYTESTSFLSGVNAERLAGQTNIKPDITHLYSANNSVWYPQELNIAGSEHFPSAPAFRKLCIFILNLSRLMNYRDRLGVLLPCLGSRSLPLPFA
ncbi:hypothetical protein D6D11_10556 [Aureobasidium pullulans]|nr:hypothetical protein D6D11_10556 [Aureobasidium pullulans]